MHKDRKNLLVRADFVLGSSPGDDRLACKRWRRILADALPRLMGCSRRNSESRVRFHEGQPEANFTGWLRIPIERRPSRRRLRKFKAKLRNRLETGLLPIGGRVLKVGVRRCKPQLAVPVVLPMQQAEVEIAQSA